MPRRGEPVADMTEFLNARQLPRCPRPDCGSFANYRQPEMIDKFTCLSCGTEFRWSKEPEIPAAMRPQMELESITAIFGRDKIQKATAMARGLQTDIELRHTKHFQGGHYEIKITFNGRSSS